MQRCPNCGGGELKIIAAILEQAGHREDPHPPGAEFAAATHRPGARGGPRLRRMCRADRRTHIATGCAAKPQPVVLRTMSGRRCLHLGEP